jgi:hypothetical protein
MVQPFNGLPGAAFLIRQRHGHENMRFIAEDARTVSFTGSVVGEHDVTGLENSLDAVTRFDLPGPGHRHKILAPRRRVQVEDGARRYAAENSDRRRPRVGGKDFLIAAELQLDFFEI